jgi:Chaperone of endosialidase
MRAQLTSTLQESLRSRFFMLLILAVLSPATVATAQTTSFTYQGRFTDGGTAATGTYDMQFKLFDTASAGNQIGSTITNGAVSVSNGVFTVQLDYGAAAFSGADRYLEIGVRLAGDANPYTILAPRQQLTSAVYAIRAGSATNADTATTATTAMTATDAGQLGGVAASQYVQTNDSRLADARTPTAGSSNYIQNTNSQQAANFNISGNGTTGGTLSGNIVSAASQYNIGSERVLSVAGVNNTFVGLLIGTANTSGKNNSFFGRAAGQANTTGSHNSFFGVAAGTANTTGSSNSFFGMSAGEANTGSLNSFFGDLAGHSNTIGSFNSFFGRSAGLSNTEGESNSFFGAAAGQSHTMGQRNSFFGGQAGTNTKTGLGNSFFGFFAGQQNLSGDYNTAVGYNATPAAGSVLSNATAIGAHAQVSQSNSIVLGSINGVNFATADTNVGIGTTAPNARFHIAVNGGNIVMGHAGCMSGATGIGFSSSLSGCTNYSLLGDGANTFLNRPTGGVIQFRENNAPQITIASGGVVSIATFGSAGIDHLCRSASNQISLCSSSLRYKTNIQPFMGGLSVLNRLRPITFDWKQGGMHDLGFGAEEIAAIEPLLITRNDKGEVEGVKYDRITAVLVNAVKEQQEQIKQQQSQIQSLKRLVCQRHRRAAVCK